MLDSRLAATQRLYWEIELLRAAGSFSRALPKLRELASIRQELALESLARNEPDGWIDLLAAITAWANAGALNHGRALLARGRQLASALARGGQTVARQLDDLEAWLDTRPMLPTLADFASPLPPRGAMEAA